MDRKSSKKTLKFLCLVMGAPLAFNPLSDEKSTIPSFWKLFYNKTDESKGYSSDLLYMDYTWKSKDMNISFSPNPYVYHPKQKSSWTEGRNFLVEKGLELSIVKHPLYHFSLCHMFFQRKKSFENALLFKAEKKTTHALWISSEGRRCASKTTLRRA